MVNKIKSFNSWRKINESQEQQLSCLMAYVYGKEKDDILRQGINLINKNDIYYDSTDEFGYENEIHCTVFYGIYSQDVFDVNQALSDEYNFTPFEIELKNITKFECDDYDVLKIDIESKQLNKLHKIILDNMDCTETHPEYHLHLTLSYVKKGTCKNLINNDMFNGKKIMVNNLIFSTDEAKYKIPLGYKTL